MKDVDDQELNVIHTFHLLAMYADRNMFSSPGPPILHNNLLGLACVQDQVVGWTQLYQVIDLLSVVGLIIVRYETYYGVVCKFRNHVWGEDSERVMSEEGRAEHTALWCYIKTLNSPRLTKMTFYCSLSWDRVVECKIAKCQKIEINMWFFFKYYKQPKMTAAWSFIIRQVVVKCKISTRPKIERNNIL